jgi:hypothetical protein
MYQLERAFQQWQSYSNDNAHYYQYGVVVGVILQWGGFTFEFDILARSETLFSARVSFMTSKTKTWSVKYYKWVRTCEAITPMRPLYPFYATQAHRSRSPFLASHIFADDIYGIPRRAPDLFHINTRARLTF